MHIEIATNRTSMLPCQQKGALLMLHCQQKELHQCRELHPRPAVDGLVKDLRNRNNMTPKKNDNLVPIPFLQEKQRTIDAN